MLFWIVSIALALMVTAFLAQALIGRAPVAETPAAAFDMKIYRDQLAEVDRDLARGTLAESEAARLRTEISRRLLAADTEARSEPESTGKGPARALGLLGAALVLVLGVATYVWLGQPGAADLPRADRIASARSLLDNRPDQEAAEAQVGGPISYPPDQPVSEDFQTLMTQLRSAVEKRSEDEQGFRLLARNEAALGNFKDAYTAQARVLEIAGTRATAQDFADYADMMILSAGGLVSAEAADALQTALHADPTNGTATYYSGLLMAQTGRHDIAFRLWNNLLHSSPDTAPWVAPIRAQLPQVAMLAGESRFELPPAAGMTAPMPGPSAEDMDAAGEMTAQERQDMVRGMVDGLAARLASDGGDAREWARLISALGVLGETDRARAIYQEALTTFEGKGDDLAMIQRAAESAGVDG
ncbi:c-type cytochrome biogenesis protein CcmI [Pseudooceanicola sp. HF7]|uniref:c-type cytochrome biogenesis protein CcmI n=1 Tax=Pseudooceanicola sp. HF7 TaxID=2721560 RepID=UPI00142FF426|nr:c-type cytochrome biogenesis protein CcmI [Pseudooceanicola sp. HF7]NIZ10662.1 c-type cytochrome biogenesis protein CcmI [Pseudooceanicola sp. HF7]